MIFNNFTSAYSSILSDVDSSPDFVSRPRGLEIKEKLCYKFEITNPRDRLPYIGDRNYSITYFVAESLWYLAGISETDWISRYSSFWKKISDDGRTANSAYGARIFKSHPYVTPQSAGDSTQWDYAINELVADNDSRRAVIHIRSPYDSYYARLDVPCTLSLQFFLRNDKVDMVVSMRSSDAILGIGNDIPAFTLFQELMSLELTQKLGRSIDVGTYRHVSNSMHIYERDYDLVKKLNSSKASMGTIPMPLMPSRPPLEILLAFEKNISSSTDEKYIVNELSALKGKIDDYWRDWAIILGAYWIGKLGNKTLQKGLMSLTSFEGYRFFTR